MIYLFDYNKIMQKDTVVHCDTEEKAKKLLEWADSKGLKWCNEDGYINDICWGEHKENTCYELFKGKFGSLNWNMINNYTILTYEEVLLNDFDLIYKIETGDFGNRCETIYNSLIGNHSADEWIFKDFKLDSIDDNKNILKGDVEKMAGIKAKVGVVVANICENKIKRSVVVSDEYSGYCIDDKTVSYKNEETFTTIYNVEKLVIDGKVIFEYEITITENDTRKDWVKVKTKLAEIELKLQCGLMEKEDYEIEKAKLYKELSKYLEVTNHKIDWKLVK